MRGFQVGVLVLWVVVGCSSSQTVRTLLKAPDDIPEVEVAARPDPEAAAAGRACEEQHDARACTRAAEYWQGDDGHPFDPTRSFRYASAGCVGGGGLACAVAVMSRGLLILGDGSDDQ